MLYHIDDDPDSTTHAAGGTGDLTAVGVASVANAAASLVVANANTERKSSKATIKAGNANTNESPTTQLPEKVNIAEFQNLECEIGYPFVCAIESSHIYLGVCFIVINPV